MTLVTPFPIATLWPRGRLTNQVLPWASMESQVVAGVGSGTVLVSRRQRGQIPARAARTGCPGGRKVPTTSPGSMDRLSRAGGNKDGHS